MFIATARHEGPGLLTVLGELLFGVAIGVAVSALVTMAWRLEVLTAEPRLQPLGPLAVAIVVYGTCTSHTPTHTWPRSRPAQRRPHSTTVAPEIFEPFGDLLSEITKFAAVLLWGVDHNALAIPPWVDCMVIRDAGDRRGSCRRSDAVAPGHFVALA